MPGTAAVELTPPCAARQALRSICAPVRTAAVGDLLVHRSVWLALHGESLLSNICTTDRHGGGGGLLDTTAVQGKKGWIAHQVWEQAAQDGTAQLHSNTDTAGRKTARRGAMVTPVCIDCIGATEQRNNMLQRLPSMCNSPSQQLRYLRHPVAHRPLRGDLLGAQAAHRDGWVQVAPCSKRVTDQRCRVSHPTICSHQTDRLGIAQSSSSPSTHQKIGRHMRQDAVSNGREPTEAPAKGQLRPRITGKLAEQDCRRCSTYLRRRRRYTPGCRWSPRNTRNQMFYGIRA